MSYESAMRLSSFLESPTMAALVAVIAGLAIVVLAFLTLEFFGVPQAVKRYVSKRRHNKIYMIR